MKENDSVLQSLRDQIERETPDFEFTIDEITADNLLDWIDSGWHCEVGDCFVSDDHFGNVYRQSGSGGQWTKVPQAARKVLILDAQAKPIGLRRLIMDYPDMIAIDQSGSDFDVMQINSPEYDVGTRVLFWADRESAQNDPGVNAIAEAVW